MKHLFNTLIMALTLLLCLACSPKVYQRSDLMYNYNTRMKSPSQLTVKSKVKVFFSETEVNQEYKVLSYSLYSPLISIPIIYSKSKQITENFIEKAATNCYNNGGNGVIIDAAGFYRIINMPSFKGDSTLVTTVVNPILDRTILDKFQSGAFNKEGKEAKKKDLAALIKEIENGLKKVSTLDEVAILNEKINAYEGYNKSLKKEKKSISNDIEDYRDDLNKAEKKIRKRLAKKK